MNTMMPLAMRKAYASLQTRTLSNFKISHWLQTGPEQYVCLDFNLAAKTKDDLREKMLSALAGLGYGRALPAAGESLWKQFVNSPNKEQFPIKTDLSPRGMILVMVRGK
jgi:hypothetical protein